MSDVKRYFFREYGMGVDPGGDYVGYEDYEADREALLARIASLEREKEEARDKALEEAAHLLEQNGQTLGSIIAAKIRAMKGTKP